MSKLILIAAVAKNNVIGKNGKVPWHIPEDIDRFKKLTKNHTVIMGRKTWESIDKKYRPLRGRTNMVVSRTTTSADYPKEVIVFGNIRDAIGVSKVIDDDYYIVGGAQIYGQTIDIADRLEITEVHQEYEGDTFFPYINRNRWKEVFRENHNGYSFVTYE